MTQGVCLRLMLFVLLAALTSAQMTPGRGYEIGEPVTRDIWVDPEYGDDAASGNVRTSALRTITEAWGRVPQGAPFSGHGYRIMLTAGIYQPNDVPAYWESRTGTQAFPVIIQSADGPGAAILPALHIFDCRYFYLIGLSIVSDGGDVVHIEQGDHVLIRDSRLTGIGDIDLYEGPYETLKINQSQNVYIEGNDISGAINNAVDFVAVQYGYIAGNKIHRSRDWCLYVKGGSAYLTIAANEVYGCGTGGFTAGQGTGFEFMVPPWLHYEAYDVKFVDNVVHDTDGAGMGVNGGYNILLAYNTLYRVGSRSHSIEILHGVRECDGNQLRCEANRLAGGWGPGIIDQEIDIPNRNVYIFNNVLYNPAGFESPDQHFAIFGTARAFADMNLPETVAADQNLRIEGNVIWNGPATLPLGVEDGEAGCQPDNPTCNAAQLRASNFLNRFEPQLNDPENGDYRPAPGGSLFAVTGSTIPPFPRGDRPGPPFSPEGVFQNSIELDRLHTSRDSHSPAGAYAQGAPAKVASSFDPYVRRMNF